MAAKEVLLTSLLQKIVTLFKSRNATTTSRMHATSTDSGRHNRLLNIQDGGQ